METQKVAPNNARIILIIVCVLAGLCLCAVVGLLALGGTAFGTAFLISAPAAGQGEAFMQALKDGDYPRAYALCSESLQQELESPQKLGEGIEAGQMRPQSWKFNSRNIENDTARLEGSFIAGRAGELELELIHVNGEWKVSYFNLSFP